jgi:hypothetical protein
MGNETTESTITSSNTYTTALTVRPGKADFSVYMTGVATVHLQRSFDSGTTWKDVNSYTGSTEATITEAALVQYRAGIKTGNYTSGSAICIIAQWQQDGAKWWQGP